MSVDERGFAEVAEADGGTDDRFLTGDRTPVRIVDGLRVWDNDLRSGTVDFAETARMSRHYWDGWFYVRRDDGGGYDLVNGGRMAVAHPFTREAPPPAPGGAGVPEIGDTFVHDGRGYFVDAWLKRADADSAAEPVGPDRCPLVFCTRDEAGYVSGRGVSGVLLRVSDVQVSGRMPWGEGILAVARGAALGLVGQYAR
jgi:hypothetical protein